MELKLLREFVINRPEGLMPSLDHLLNRLGEHGEVQAVMVNGDTFSMHLGDMGEVTPECLYLQDREGQVWLLAGCHIVSVFTHLGYKEN